MKNSFFVLLALLLTTTFINAQNTDKPRTLKTTQQIENEEHAETLDAKRVIFIGSTTGSGTYSSWGTGAVTIGTAADTLSGTSVACDYVEVQNLTAGAILYIGSSSSLTTSNGIYALHYGDIAGLNLANLNKVYLISSTAGTDVRYSYFVR